MEKKVVSFELKSDTLKEVKEASGLEFGYFEGYASVFGNIDSYQDVMMPGAFSKSLGRKQKYSLYWQHSMMKMLGSITESYEDANGLYVKGRINCSTAMGKDIYALLKSGDITGMSIGYITRECEYDNQLRMLKEVDLIEVSLVSEPANPLAQVTSVKCLQAMNAAKSMAEVEKILAEYGLSQNESKAVISKVKELSVSRDGLEGQKAVSRDEKSDSQDDWTVVAQSLTHLTSQIRK
jgi:HK97 family phage prohead protease